MTPTSHAVQSRQDLVDKLVHRAIPPTDAALARELDRQIEDWIESVGIFAGRTDVHDTRFGLFALLTHPSALNVDLLLLAAKNIATLVACDDYYCDDEALGADPLRTAPRLSRALSIVDPPSTLHRFEALLAEETRKDPILRALRETRSELAGRATPAQMGRYEHATIAMFMGMSAEAMWRYARDDLPLWEYLSHRQANSGKPCLSIIDVVGGYEVPPDAYYHPDVARAIDLANAQILIVNDLYSTKGERTSAPGSADVVTILMRERSCDHAEAAQAGVAIHNEIATEYLALVENVKTEGGPTLSRFMADLTGWISGNLRWHLESGRHRD
ncbi:hypothetical protein O7627_14895 [Solwaraspora sp. WMMD1047]|uniref:terpene synthase family protein n=1 Tax=Solwaraspora sp. WMMD1047 TaxID=3016102 RepID=UPI0024172F5C|nr:hypothetical protein [Solwaraspora sp. WMMD1047]MDG4830581.1 hypothetical protein [Solwaraspora sp. WMMD1047]